MIKQKCFVFGFAILLVVSLFLMGCAAKPKTETTTTSTTVTSVSEGKSLVEKKCTVCHNTERIYLKKRDAAEWGSIVDKMIGKGAVVNNADRTKIIEYLASLNQ